MCFDFSKEARNPKVAEKFKITQMVRGKFTVSQIQISQGSQKIRTADGSDYEKDGKGYAKTKLRTIVLNPVYANNDPKHENTRFWDYSPSGEIRLNPDAWEQFEVGKEYYVDSIPAG